MGLGDDQKEQYLRGSRQRQPSCYVRGSWLDLPGLVISRGKLDHCLKLPVANSHRRIVGQGEQDYSNESRIVRRRM